MNDNVSPFETIPAVEFSLPDLCEIINDAFTGYVGGEVKFTPQILAGFLAANDIQLNLSRVIIRRDVETDTHERLGIALIARHGWSSRVALMGIVQSAQGQGVGKALMHALIAQARERGDKILELEVIEQNPRAVALYEKVGFSIVRRLLGFEGNDLHSPAAQSVPFQPCSIAEAARYLIAYAPADTPWQLNGYSIVTFAPPSVAYTVSEGEFAGCYAVITNPEHERITVLSLVVPPEKQRQGVGTRLMGALIAAHGTPQGGKAWRAPSIIPEEYAPVFTAHGLARAEISQFQMRMSL